MVHSIGTLILLPRFTYDRIDFLPPLQQHGFPTSVEVTLGYPIKKLEFPFLAFHVFFLSLSQAKFFALFITHGFFKFPEHLQPF